MAWRSLSTNSGRSRSVPSCPGTASRLASRFTDSGARRRRARGRCSATPPAPTSSIRPDRCTRCPAPTAAWCSWSGNGRTRSSTGRADMGWHAALELGFAAASGATRLARRKHRGPLVVQRPFLPEGPGVAHVYVLHPPGGLVGGDELTLDVEVDAGAHALVTTPAASKIYRTNGAAVRQVQRLRVAGGATLEWLPQEAIIYDGARATLETRVELGPGARFIGFDAVCFGLPARRAPFESGHCRQMFEIFRDGRPLLIERGRYDAADAV